MIYIKEDLNKKMAGMTSIFIWFEYRQNIVDVLKQFQNYNYDKKTRVWELPATSLSKVIDMLSEIDDIDLVLMNEQEDSSDYENVELDVSAYKTHPFDYQIDAIKYGLTHDKWLLLDAPGLGKTLTIIYTAQELKARMGIEHCLIVCGINTLKFNWKNEILKHSDLSCRILGEKINSKGKLKIGSVSDRLSDLKSDIEEFFVITNVETIRDENILKEITKGKNKFDMIVVDEVHKCKSPTSQQGKHLLKLDSKYKIGATGTVLMNSPLDAYVPLKWIGAEKSTYTYYKYYYCDYGGQFHNILNGYRNTDVLKEQIERCSLRRTKDLLDLPPKTIINEYVEMDSKQAKFYSDIQNGVKSSVDKIDLNTSNVLSLVGRLRQATACPSLLTTEDISSAKIDRCIDIIEQLVNNGEKVVVFSTFKGTVFDIFEKITALNPLLCTGDSKDDYINECVNMFQNDDEHMVMLGTWQKMGTGITLTRASYMIFIDTPWTSAEYVQNQDRIYRIGTKNSVFIYNLITKDTVDERVLEILNDKEAISDYIVDDKISPNSIESLKKYIQEL